MGKQMLFADFKAPFGAKISLLKVGYYMLKLSENDQKWSKYY